VKKQELTTELLDEGDQMTLRILFVIISNLIICFFLISSIEGDHLHRTWLLYLLMFAMNMLFWLYSRRKRIALPVAVQQALTAYFRWTTWIYFLPIVAGVLVFIVGIVQLSWKLLLFGALAIGVGILRLMLRSHTRRIIERNK
jgi:hypothetical protein